MSEQRERDLCWLVHRANSVDWDRLTRMTAPTELPHIIGEVDSHTYHIFESERGDVVGTVEDGMCVCCDGWQRDGIYAQD